MLTNKSPETKNMPTPLSTEHQRPQSVRVIYERGITARIIGTEWHVMNLMGGRSERIDRPALISERYGVKPVVVIKRISRDKTIDLLLRKTTQAPFGLEITDVTQKVPKISSVFFKGHNLIYLLEAVQYHCMQLARHYSRICKRFSEIPGDESNDCDSALFSGAPEPYFEFDSLVTAVRRAYDSCRYLLWQYFGAAGENMPGSIDATLRLCSTLPPHLSERMKTSWSIYGEEVKEYRDCIQHYVPLDFGLSTIKMEKLDQGPWSARVLIPDNPSARSVEKFLYDKNRDALTYGWEVSNEILEVAMVLLEAIAAHESSATE